MADNVPITVAEYLKSEALFAVAASPSAVVWGDRAVESETISPLYFADDAGDEAGRQAAFLKGPNGEDVVTVAGNRKDLFLKAVTIVCDKLGYAAGKVAFVIGFDERADGHTDLIVVAGIG